MDLKLKIDGTNGNIEIYLGKDSTNKLKDSDGSIVFTFYEGKYVMSYHSKRKGWEFPAGRREEGETAAECAIRETFEETGAILVDVIPLGYYLVSKHNNVFKTAVFMSRVEKFEPKPHWSETDIVKLFEELPGDISYKDDVYKIVLEYIEKIDSGCL
ncbi:NUDIX domain-containing protein [Brassicibacter mesophilus]|jgi:8-oxo-dGTP diphosphatase|uniref:NUDIX domain-containing protein n=1 Tax=Brassicibacter mesophilus TaxID=745119 RepID=UPI003D1E110E